MIDSLQPGDLVIATPRPFRPGGPGITACRHGSSEWTTRIPQDSLLLVAAPAGVTDYIAKVIHNDQMFYILCEDVKLAKVTQ